MTSRLKTISVLCLLMFTTAQEIPLYLRAGIPSNTMMSLPSSAVVGRLQCAAQCMPSCLPTCLRGEAPSAEMLYNGVLPGQYLVNSVVQIPQQLYACPVMCQPACLPSCTQSELPPPPPPPSVVTELPPPPIPTEFVTVELITATPAPQCIPLCMPMCNPQCIEVTTTTVLPTPPTPPPPPPPSPSTEPPTTTTTLPPPPQCIPACMPVCAPMCIQEIIPEPPTPGPEPAPPLPLTTTSLPTTRLVSSPVPVFHLPQTIIIKVQCQTWPCPCPTGFDRCAKSRCCRRR